MAVLVYPCSRSCDITPLTIFSFLTYLLTSVLSVCPHDNKSGPSDRRLGSQTYLRRKSGKEQRETEEHSRSKTLSRHSSENTSVCENLELSFNYL